MFVASPFQRGGEEFSVMEFLGEVDLTIYWCTMAVGMIRRLGNELGVISQFNS